jgi:hypothetical protein
MPAADSRISQRALIVGIGEYPNPTDRLPAVAADVREMAKVLSSKHGRFSPQGTTILADGQATRRRIQAALKSAFGAASGETVFVYLAGHGFEAGGNYYYVAYDTTDEHSAVPLTEIKTLFDQTKSRRAFLWLDFCHSGGILARGGRDDMNAIRRGIGVVRGEGKVIVAACTGAQKAYESSSVGHGLFTHALLRGLRGEAKSAQGEVTAHSLYEFIDHEVADTRQQPVFFGETTGRIVLMHIDKRSAAKVSTSKTSIAPRPKKKSSPKINGTWMMLGDDFFIAERVRNHSDGSISVELSPGSGDDEAKIAALRPTQFGSRSQLPFAVDNDACEVQVEELVSEHAGSKQQWNLKLRRAQHQTPFPMEMSVNGMGPDEIARLRASRILLNDPPPQTARGFRGDTLLEGSISGYDNRHKADTCVVQDIFRQFGESSTWKAKARLKAVFLLKITGTVEHVIRLTIGSVRKQKVLIDFQGKRSQRYGNRDAQLIEIKGECELSENH